MPGSGALLILSIRNPYTSLTSPQCGQFIVILLFRGW
jgi:hypothetical protein